MVPTVNDATTTARDEVGRRTGAADPDAPRPEPLAETDEASAEEAGYGYGV